MKIWFTKAEDGVEVSVTSEAVELVVVRQMFCSTINVFLAHAIAKK